MPDEKFQVHTHANPLEGLVGHMDESLSGFIRKYPEAGPEIVLAALDRHIDQESKDKARNAIRKHLEETDSDAAVPFIELTKIVYKEFEKNGIGFYTQDDQYVRLKAMTNRIIEQRLREHIEPRLKELGIKEDWDVISGRIERRFEKR